MQEPGSIDQRQANRVAADQAIARESSGSVVMCSAFQPRFCGKPARRLNPTVRRAIGFLLKKVLFI
jgi:hypothetical protein